MGAAVVARLTVSWRVLKHGGKAVIGLLVGWLITLLLLVRDNVLSDEQRKSLQFSNFIPHLSTWQWVSVGLVLALLFVLEGAFRLHREVSTVSAPPAESQPAADLFKTAGEVMQSLPADSAATIEARYVDPAGGMASLTMTPGGGVAGGGNKTTEGASAAPQVPPPGAAGAG